MTVEGSGQIIRNPGAASGCCPVTARFIAGTTCGPQQVVDGLADIIWQPPGDPYETWDDIGFDPSDYSSGSGTFYFGSGMAGVYLINVYVAVDPAQADTPGEGYVLIELSSGASFDEKDAKPPMDSHATELVIPSGPRRWYEGQSFSVKVWLSDTVGVSEINPASIAFTKLLSL